MGYVLEGDLLEVCNCNVLCPCWIGEDPDRGTCDSSLAYRITKGEIDGVDVTGVVVASVVRIPGNVLKGGWTRQLYIDSEATTAQSDAVISALMGQRGGPLAELAALIAKDLPAQRARIIFDLVEGKGTLKVDEIVDAVMEPYRGPTGTVTTLNESIFTTIPGAPAYVAKAEHFRVHDPSLGLDMEIEGRNAIQGAFRFEHDMETAAA
jgi:hypothetical protein